MVLSMIGLILNFLGTILVAFSIRKGSVEAWKDSKNKREDMASFKLWKFRLGIWVLALGFPMQIWGMFHM